MRDISTVLICQSIHSIHPKCALVSHDWRFRRYFWPVTSATCISCHMTSSEVTNSFLAITFYSMSYGIKPTGNAFVSFRRIDWYASWPSQIMTLNWGHILKLPFLGQIMYLYIWWDLTRERRWCNTYFLSFLSRKLFLEYDFGPF